MIYVGIVIVLMAFCVAISYRYFNPKADDSDPIEKVCEDVIKKETGIDISIKDQK